MGELCKRTSYCPVFLLALFCIYPATGNCHADKVSLVFTQIPATEIEKGTDRFNFQSVPPGGSRIVWLDPVGSAGKLRVLTEDFHSACDPCISFDGKKLLFAARKEPNDKWNIWEMEINGKNPRQITSDLGDCREPAYLAKSSITPPEFTDKVRWITFTSTAAGTYDESGEEKATALYVRNLEPIEGRGTVTWRTTFNLSHDFSPTVLDDGRVLFSSWQQRGNRFYPHGMIALMTMNWAGTGLNLFYGNHQGEKVKSMACEMPDRTLVFVESDGSSYDGSGQLASVSFKRPLHSYRKLSNGMGRYHTPHPFPEGRLAVSYSSGDESYGVYLFDYDKERPNQVLYDDPGWDDIDVIPVVPSDEPMGRITIVEDSKETGHLQCLNVYDSDRPEAASIEKGQVKRVRFVEGLPPSQAEVLSFRDAEPGPAGIRPNSKHVAPLARTRILGEAPVETDGSFYVELPADVPFFIQTLDENGMALQTMRGWMWVRRGSRRSCIGCHEDKELTPENRATQALIKGEPARLLTSSSERRTVDFRTNIAPIVGEKCEGCHNGQTTEGGLNLTTDDVTHARGYVFSRAYESLTQPLPGTRLGAGGKYVHPGSARNSPLIRLIFQESDEGSNRERRRANPTSQTHPYVPLSDREKRVFVEWIDLGGQWDGGSGKNEY